MVERQSIKFMASPVQYFFRPGCHGQFCNKSVKWLRPQAYPRLPQGVDRVVQLRKARELVLIRRSDTGRELFCSQRCSAADIHTRWRRKWIKHGLTTLRKRPPSKQARQLLTLRNVSASKCNPVQDLANRASEVGRQSVGRAGELADRVAPQARQVASNLYEQGSRSGQAVRQYASQEPFAAMLVAGLIGFTLGYLIRGATNQGDRAG